MCNLEIGSLQGLDKGLGNRDLILDDENPGLSVTLAHRAILGREIRNRSKFYLPITEGWPSASPRGMSMDPDPQAERTRKSRQDEMKSTRVKIATAASLLALGGLAGVAISSSTSNETEQVAAVKPKVKTKVIRKTIRKTKKAPAATAAAGSGTGYVASAGTSASDYSASTYSAPTTATSSSAGDYAEPVTSGQSGSGGYSDDDYEDYEDDDEDYEGYEDEDYEDEDEGEDD